MIFLYNLWVFFKYVNFFQNHDFLLIRELFLKFVNIFQIREKSNLIFLFVNFFQICDMVSTLWTFSDSDFFSKCRELFQMHELFLNSHFKILWTFFKFRKPTTDFFSEQYNNIRENRGKEWMQNNAGEHVWQLARASWALLGLVPCSVMRAQGLFEGTCSANYDVFGSLHQIQLGPLDATFGDMSCFIVCEHCWACMARCLKHCAPGSGGTLESVVFP